ncbi:MAG: DEAD/DEAH box helicase [Candidatus Pacebacteria bacterium]|nr:DEAD/DEAH box helicase [Candidatus Paceibacterota bacterium]
MQTRTKQTKKSFKSGYNPNFKKKNSTRSNFGKGSIGPIENKLKFGNENKPVYKSKFGNPRDNRGRRFVAKNSNKFSGSRIDVSRFIQKSSIDDDNVETYVPKNKFIDFKIDQRLKDNIVKKGYLNPTPIQDQTIPLILEGKDVVGIANTGTGKTAAFLIPSINDTLLDRSNKTIIIVPTRELAQQIEKEFREFTFGLKIFSVVCIGGTSIRNQFFDLRKNYNFIIGTPGRIKDMVQRKALNMSQFKMVILDEADRMLDMGFIDDIKFLISQMPSNKKSMCFSATFPDEIESLVKKFLKEPIKISVKTKESSGNVDQDVVRVSDKNKKFETLCGLLNKKEFNKVLIFGKTKYGVEKLSIALNQKGFKTESIHGDKSQVKRQKALKLFKDNRVNILVATDVAARGLDIDDVSHVINYDIPATYDDYVHRIGRTGRANKKGSAITFI